VCTDPDFRCNGFASACFDDAMQKAYDDGVDIMIVSGDRNLYRMRNCIPVGRDTVFQITSGSIPRALEDIAFSVTVENMTGEELPLVMECYDGEPVRYQRSEDDYRCVLQCGWVMDRPADFLVIRERNIFRGYVAVQSAESDGSAQLVEFAGDRNAILAALP